VHNWDHNFPTLLPHCYTSLICQPDHATTPRVAHLLSHTHVCFPVVQENGHYKTLVYTNLSTPHSLATTQESQSFQLFQLTFCCNSPSLQLYCNSPSVATCLILQLSFLLQLAFCCNSPSCCKFKSRPLRSMECIDTHLYAQTKLSELRIIFNNNAHSLEHLTLNSLNDIVPFNSMTKG
jgi:hypothetical protein